ncbi:MAG: N-acyl-D-amino-acid deacylase family protein [Thermomicrobiales bacterium]
MTAPTSILIANGRIVDGTGNPWFYGDLVLGDGRVEAIAPAGSFNAGPNTETVDATGLVVCPGFIDIQSHSIVPFLSDRRAISKITQGVTTEIMGEDWTPAPFGGRIDCPFHEGQRRFVGDGFDDWMKRARGWTRFGDWLAAIEDLGVAVNIGSFVGGSTVREFGKGYDLGPPSLAELNAMRRVVAEAMEDGAFGLATALIYPPGAFADTAELTALCEVVAAYRGVHITHIRSEEARIVEALDEAIAIARRTGVATEIYHLKLAGQRNWDRLPLVIDMINLARVEGLDVGADMYPYEAAGTGLSACLPPWASEGGNLYKRLRDEPDFRARVRAEMAHPSGDWENFAAVAGPENLLLASFGLPEHKQRYQGKRLAQIATELGQDWIDAALDLLAAEQHDIFTFYFMMSEGNLHRQLQQPWMKIGTDAGGLDPEAAAKRGLAHPRAYGTFTRILGRFVREQGVVPIEDAVRKMSAATAARLGLFDRGVLRPGLAADVVAFDPTSVTDRATYDDPHRLSTGIHHVWVNGVAVLRDGQHTGATPGRRLHGPGYRATRD